MYISLFPTGDSRTDEMQLQGAESETAYLCLRHDCDASTLQSGRCREVICGMRILFTVFRFSNARVSRPNFLSVYSLEEMTSVEYFLIWSCSLLHVLRADILVHSTDSGSLSE